MLNRTGVKKETLGNTIDILFANSASVSVGVVLVKSADMYKAGTPITVTGAKVGVVSNRAGGTYKKATASDVVVGVLLHDVDASDAAANASICIRGAFNVTAFKDVYTASYTDALIATNSNLLFVE